MDEKKFNALSKSQQEVVIKLATEAERQGVNPELVIAIAEAETGGKFSHYSGDKVLKSPAGAVGLMQVMPDTANIYNKKFNLDIDPTNEDSNIKGGVFILKDLLTQYKSPRTAVALYNASPKAVSTFIKSYETDPDKAILSLPEETRNYSLRISKNFNLDDDKETGLINTQDSEGSPKENPNDPFSSGVPLANKVRAASVDENTTTTDEEPREIPVAGGVAGAAANLFLPPLTNPEMPVKIDTGKAQEANLTAQDKLELARRNVQQFVPQGVQNLESAFQQSQGNLDYLRNEQRLAEARLRGLPRTAPLGSDQPIFGSPIEDSLSILGGSNTRTNARSGRASGPKVEGDSGVRNWTIAEAGQTHEMPEAILDMATNKTADDPKGGKFLINKDLENLEKIKRIGLGEYGLARTEGGVQLALPPETVAERQADEERRANENQEELNRRAEEARMMQAMQERQLEIERLNHEAELENLRQQRSQAGQQHNALTGQLRQARPLQRALTKAEADAEIARRKLARANEQPSALTRPLDVAGYRSAKIGALPRTVVGGVTGTLGVMSYQEALERFKAGDTSEAVLKALEAGAAGAMVVPPAGKTLKRVRGAGALGAGALGLFEAGRFLLKDAQPDE
jgi:soluble lytic murein transglycosylase-like protein